MAHESTEGDTAPIVAAMEGDTAPIVAIDQEDHANGDGDSAYDSDQLSRYTDSLTSSVKAYKFENGRRYHAYHAGAYNFPNDNPEQDRLDMFHHIILLGCDGKLHLAPIQCDGKRILDIGCGTGIWAVQMGDEYPTADITGNDLSPIQPGWVPPNVRFLVDDIEQPWAETQPYDYIHCRYMAASIQDWPRLVKQCFDNLKPGGWVEFQDYDTTCHSQDNSIPPDYKVAAMLSFLKGACDSIGRLLDPGPLLKGWVEDAGFEYITQNIIPLPVGIWPKDKKMKEIGAFMTLQYTEGVEAFTLAPFTGILGWTKEEVEVFNVGVRKDAKDRSIHTLHNL
ncbi:S-adenosyl-L-methionine-dependent methyltransferase [Rhexocercosporidium sp. MPI-PUGE-AT-0058]|nr:S-adenosyl-L-methionine-dependent methyltransferase [Rhexocercosporidium sp. MPI-PUGE-AT-0058]